MKKANYIVFDTETGGLDSEKNPILEIALITFDNNFKELMRYETYIKPYDDLIVEPQALAANGIKMRNVEKEGISKSQAIKNLEDYFKRSMPGRHPSLKPVVVGHNIPFDIRFMDKLFRSSKNQFSSLISDIYVDTMVDAKRAWPTIDSLNLSRCCEEADIKLVSAHRAMPDVIATYKLFKFFTERIRNSDSKTESNQKINHRTTFQF